ncbi:MAG: Maf family protein [Candidatus Krumholzibacteriia bacterium]
MNPLLPEAVQRNLILGSRSPRRRDILQGLDLSFDIVPAADHVEQMASALDALQRPVECARLKARDVADRHPRATVIGADTMVFLDGEALEKPVDDEEARAFLRRLSGRVHTVITGVAVCRHAEQIEVCGHESTRVSFRDLSHLEIDGYVASGEGRDKAGAYAVQGLGAGLVRSLEGCFYNVVGLPVALLFDLLKKGGGVS